MLFTDGLFERRGVPLDDGRAQVRAVLEGSARLPLHEFCDVLLEEMLGEDVEDDVAVLAVRAHPIDAGRPPEAGPEVLPAVVAPARRPRPEARRERASGEEDGVRHQSGWRSRYLPKCGTVNAICPRSAE